jgi:hypothetical protein
MRYGIFAFPLFSVALIASGCGLEPRTVAGPLCGDEGTHTVPTADGCRCEVGYRPNATRDACVIEETDVTPDAVVADGGLDDGAVEDTAPADTAPPIEGTMREVDAMDCASGCANLGFPCATTCESGAGFASYGYYDWDYGWYVGVHQEDLSVCDAVPADSYSEAGETYELGRLVCCCEIPESHVVSSSPGDTRTCDSICADAGYDACAEFHEWPGEDVSGGTLATYERPETGSVTYVVMGCAADPPATRRIAGAERYLRDYRCACF